MNGVSWIKRYERLLPWAAGAGLAVSHIAVASSCTLPKEGRCSTCGSCVVALTALVSWALYKKKQGDNFYSDTNRPA